MYAIRFPSGDHWTCRNRSPGAACNSFLGFSPSAPMIQISDCDLPPMYAIWAPDGETEARPASSRNFRGLPPRIEIAQIPVVSADSPGPTAARLVPSRNQERLAHLKQNPSGRGSEWVSPDSSNRTNTPV